MKRLLSVVVMAAGLACPAFAGMSEMEVIAGVRGENPVDARERAVDYAKKRAFFLTLSRLDPARANSIAESLSTEQIYAHIRGYELVEDKLDNEDPNYYLGKYKVSVATDMVKRLLSDDSAQQPQEVNPILVLPVLFEDDRVMLWESDNIWRSIWNSVALEQGEGVLVVPYGDPTDTLITDSATVLGYGFAELSELAARYGAGEVVVAAARYQKDTTPPGLDVVLRRLGPEVNKSKKLYFEAQEREGTPESVLPDAARTIAVQLKEIARTYQGEQLRRIANANKVELRAEFRRINDWVGLQEKLSNLPRIIRLDVENISIQTASATLMYDTDPEAMQEIMRANGLFVRPMGDYWMVALP